MSLTCMKIYWNYVCICIFSVGPVKTRNLRTHNIFGHISILSDGIIYLLRGYTTYSTPSHMAPSIFLTYHIFHFIRIQSGTKIQCFQPTHIPTYHTQIYLNMNIFVCIFARDSMNIKFLAPSSVNLHEQFSLKRRRPPYFTHDFAIIWCVYNMTNHHYPTISHVHVFTFELLLPICICAKMAVFQKV